MNQRALAAEFVGTFMFMSSVLGAAFYSFGAPAGPAGIVGVALSIGFTVMALTFAIGDISGGHFNPAVTLGLIAVGATLAASTSWPFRSPTPRSIRRAVSAARCSAALRP
jgi:aquaporin Z